MHIKQLVNPNIPAQIKIDVVPELPAPNSPKLYDIDSPMIPNNGNTPIEILEVAAILKEILLFEPITLNIFHLDQQDALCPFSLQPDSPSKTRIDVALKVAPLELPTLGNTTIKQLSGGMNLSATSVAKALRFTQYDTRKDNDFSQQLSPF